MNEKLHWVLFVVVVLISETQKSKNQFFFIKPTQYVGFQEGFFFHPLPGLVTEMLVL